MPKETQHLEQRVAALQSGLNARDQALGDAATENNGRELSRRDWFDEAQRLQAELDKRPSQVAMSLQTKIKRLEARLADRDALLRRALNGGDDSLGLDIAAALSVGAEPGAKPQAEPVYMVRTHGSCCWEEVGSGSLEDFQSMPEEYELRALYTRPAEHPAPAAVVPEGYCVMPRLLTAENGAKALLLGEFTLQSTHECPECRELEEPSEGCEICDGEGEYGQNHVLPWDLIKFIYSRAVKGLAVKAEPAKS